MADTIRYKTDYLRNTKVLIKSALQTAGAPITDETPFRDYAMYIAELIPSGQEETENVMRIINLISIHLNGGAIRTAADLLAEYEAFAAIAEVHMPSENES